MNTLRLRPHHLLDIIQSHGEGFDRDKRHPWGAAVAAVTERVLSDIDQVFIVVSGVDSICETCAKLEDEVCRARLSDDLLMRDYNDDLDSRLFERIVLTDGQRITIREFLERARKDMDGILGLFSRGDRAHRLQMTRDGLEKLGV